MTGPLDGIRVLEVTQIVAGPYCGVNLADLGADVVKIESPGGDGIRATGQFVPGESKFFHTLNRGKRSLVLDLQQPSAQALVHRIIPQFDVFLINSRAGVAERLHLDYDSLCKFRPDIVYLESTGYGASGPSANHSGSDIVAQAYSGLMAAEGKVDDYGAPQSISCTAVADYSTGLAAAMGICAALYRRAITGEGDFLQTSLLQTALSIQSASVSRVPVADALMERPMREAVEAVHARGGDYAEVVKTRAQSRIGAAIRLYYNGYRVRDGAVILGALTPANRDQMRRALGITDDPTAEADFNALDLEHVARAEALSARIRDIMLTKTMDEWVTIFTREGAPISKVNFPEDMSADPQVTAMGFLVDLDHELTGPERVVGPVVHARRHPTGSARPAPPLGRHTEEVLAELGVEPDTIAALRAAAATV
ncbi:MAG: CoA transferase [Chloroflexi bacterium]|nr:CoA transferase [Chloroflexota bacterium]